MKKTRPVNLNLMTIRFPIAAIASILHRVSGALLFLFIPLFLWMLNQSLTSSDTFQALQSDLSSPFFKLLIWALLTGLIYHLIAGVRHLIMDLGWGEDKQSGKLGAQLVFVFAILAALLIGVWLWAM